MRPIISRASVLIALLAVVTVIAACAIGPSSSSGTKTPTATGASGTATTTAEANGTPTAPPVIPTNTTPPGVPTPTTIPCPRSDTPFGSFVHTASSRNSAGDYTIFSLSALYCQPNAILRVTPNWNSPGTGVYNNHPIGVYYIGGSTQRWAIFNEDFAAIPNGATFNVDYGFAVADAALCVHTATAASNSGDYTKIGCETGSDNPNTIMIVTPNWNSPGSGVYNNHPIGVYHSGNIWYIFNEDIAAIPTNTTFNIARINGFVQTAAGGNISGDATIINNAGINGNPGAKLQVTQNWNPGSGSGVYNKHNIGVYYIGGGTQRWAIFNQDGATMTSGASFNVSYS